MTASTVAQYLAVLPADRRAALSAVRKAIHENLPDELLLMTVIILSMTSIDDKTCN